MAQEDWDPFADPADDPAALAQAEEEAKARAEVRERTPEDSLPEEAAELFPAASGAGGSSLALARGSAVERRRQREREELALEFDSVDLLEAFPPPALAPGELCVAHFVLDVEPAEVVLELPRLDAEDRKGSGAHAVPIVGGGFIAVWPDARAELLEPVPARELARHGPRTVGGAAGYSRAIVHTQAVLSERMCDPLTPPQPEAVHSRKQHSYVELRDFCRFAPVAEGSLERTIMRRSFWGLEVVQGGGPGFKEGLCNVFEAENRRLVARWAPAALASPPAPAPPPPLPAAPGAGAGGRSGGPPPALTLEQAVQLQEMLIAEYRKTEFQVKLHASWAAAGDDQVKQLKARREVCLPIQGPVVERFGFEAAQKGVNQSVIAFKPWNEHPEVASRNMTMQYLVNPLQQDQEFIEGHLSASAQVSSQHLYGALRLPELYKADKELVALAKAGATSRVRLSIEQNLSDPNIVVPDKLGFINEARSRFYFIEERTPLVAAVEHGHLGVFDLLLSYQHLVDVNKVCLEWSVSECYKSYTALDLGQACERNRAHGAAAVMVQRLLAAGARLAEQLPEPERDNPFVDWKKHFPDANLHNIGAQSRCGEHGREEPGGGTEHARGSQGGGDCPGGMNYGPEPDHGPGGWQSGFPGPPPGGGGPGPPPQPPPSRGRGGGWRLPPAPSEGGKDLEAAVAQLRQRLLSAGEKTPEERQRFLRHLFLEWHPDKNPLQQELATKVFQWLQGVKDSSS